MQKSKHNYLLFLLLFFFSLLSVALAFYPLYVSGPRAAFFGFEPQVVYVANAFKYMYTHKISYSSHPATPTITLLAYAFAPLRIYAKFIEHIPFFLWVIRNVFTLFNYGTLVISAIFAVATGIFLLAVYNLTHKYLAIIIAWLGLWIYSSTPYLGVIIQSEPLSFLILSLWFLVFSRFIQKKSLLIYLFLCGLSGLAMANKIPNTFFVIASLLLALTFPKAKLKNKVLIAVKGLMLSVAVFFIGTWPIRAQYINLFGFINRLITHSGVHGRGESMIFSLSDYLSSANILFVREKIPAMLVLATIFLFAIYYKKLSKSFRDSALVLLASMVSALLIFAKYPLVHYHLFQYVGVLFIFCYLVTRFIRPLQILIIGLLVPYVVNSTTAYWKLCFKATRQALVLENFVSNNPPEKASVWEFGSSSDYALIHLRNWVGYPFSELLLQERPDLYGLAPGLSGIDTGPGKTEEIFNVCWDQLYIQKATLDRFKEKYPDKDLEIAPIFDSIRNMYIITSDHCKEGF